MKKLIFVFAGVFILALIFSGCGFNSKRTTIAGNGVLDNAGSDMDHQKIVTFYVIGKGLEPEHARTKGEAKLLAERAAVADGYRQFVEKIQGVYVDAYLKAGYGAVDQEMISTKTQSWLRGAEVIEIRQGAFDITEAHMQLRIHFTKKGMVWWPSGIGSGVMPS